MCVAHHPPQLIELSSASVSIDQDEEVKICLNTPAYIQIYTIPSSETVIFLIQESTSLGRHGLQDYIEYREELLQD